MTSDSAPKPAAAPGRRRETERVTRGVRRFLAELGMTSFCEWTPSRGLRIDVAALSPKGEIWAIEVKSGLEDLRADVKWAAYKAWCDRLYFAVGPDFPLDATPAAEGLIRADGFDAAIMREAETHALAPARRKALTLKFARDAAARLHRLEDPGAAAFDG